MGIKVQTEGIYFWNIILIGDNILLLS